MKNKIILAAMMLLSLSASAESGINQEGEHFDVRAGWSVGGTMPLDMPASIRSLNAYRLKPNVQVGADYEHKFNKTWGIELGMNFENKSMETDAKVKNYHMTIVKDGEEIEGNFTGNVVTDVDMWQFAIPLRATFWARRNVKVKFGPYVAFAFCTEGSFTGYAYDGYLRKDDPTGPRVDLGHDLGDRGDYDFGESMRSVNWGLDLGADWYLGKRIGVYADLTWGLNNAFKSDFKTIDQAMYPVYGTIGAVYRLK